MEKLRICPWCRRKQKEVQQDIIKCICGYQTEFCFLTGFPIFTKRKGSKTALIGPHGDVCTLDSKDRRRLFDLKKA